MSSAKASEAKKTVRRLDLLRGVLILTLVLYIAVTLIINSEYLTADRILRMRSDLTWALRSSSDVPVELDGDVLDVQLFQDGCAVLSMNGLNIYNSGGNQYSEHPLRYSSPRMVIGGQYILCFDRGGTDWCLMNTFRVLCSGTETEPIISASVSSSGLFSLSTEKFEYKGCVTVYNTNGVPLARWNSDTYLVETFFTSRNEVTVVGIAPAEEKISTVFRVFNFRSGEITASVTATDAVPYALSLKSDGNVEMLSVSGVWRFDGDSVSSVHAYRDAVPGIYYQGREGTMISYGSSGGTCLVEAIAPSGDLLFSAEYPTVRSLCCYRDRYFVLTEDRLFVLDASGNLLSDTEASAQMILASPEIVLLRSSSGVTKPDLASIL